MASGNTKDLPLQVLKDLRQDMRQVRGEVGELREEVGGLRAGLGEVREKVGGMRTELGELRIEMRGELARVWDEFRTVREELNVGFRALIQNDDRRFNDHEGRLRLVEKKTGLRRRRTP